MKLETLRKERYFRAGNRLLSPFYLDLGGDYRDAVFLAGSGRSGTTWLSEIINHRRDYRYVFEPFHPERVGLCRSFRRKQYLRPDDDREEFLGPARAILSGDLRSSWTDRFHRSFFPRRRLVKDIRANLFLGWLQANFPGLRVVFLLRHPCAVADSKIKLGWRSRVEEILAQEDLLEDHLPGVRDELQRTRSEFERHVFVWCVENYVPLKQLRGANVHLLCYEDLCLYPEDELRRLFGFLGEYGRDGDLDRSVYQAAERLSPTGGSEGRSAPGERVSGWQSFVTGGQLDRAVEILELFGLGGLYNREPVPGPSAARALMRRGLG